MIRGLVEDGVLQPDYALSGLLELSPFRVVRFEMMRLEVAVNERMRMTSARLVHMEGRQHRTEEQERYGDEPRRHTSDRTIHGAIMATAPRRVTGSSSSARSSG